MFERTARARRTTADSGLFSDKTFANRWPHQADGSALNAYYAALQAYSDQQITHEGALETAFQQLLADTARQHGWMLVPKMTVKRGGRSIIPDGTVRDDFNLHRGYWEAKDTDDDLSAEIAKKSARGYPLTNTIFEDTRRAVLFQNGGVAFEADLHAPQQLADLLNAFYSHTEPDIEGFEYESLEPWPLEWIETPGVPLSYHVEKMKLAKDKKSLAVNPSLTLANIPEEVSQYRLGNRSALQWVVDQYQISEDKRSGIRSDPNRPDDPEYIVRLVGQVVRVSVETTRIVNNLPDFQAK